MELYIFNIKICWNYNFIQFLGLIFLLYYLSIFLNIRYELLHKILYNYMVILICSFQFINFINIFYIWLHFIKILVEFLIFIQFLQFLTLFWEFHIFFSSHLHLLSLLFLLKMKNIFKYLFRLQCIEYGQIWLFFLFLKDILKCFLWKIFL